MEEEITIQNDQEMTMSIMDEVHRRAEINKVIVKEIISNMSRVTFRSRYHAHTPTAPIVFWLNIFTQLYVNSGIDDADLILHMGTNQHFSEDVHFHYIIKDLNTQKPGGKYLMLLLAFSRLDHNKELLDRIDEMSDKSVCLQFLNNLIGG